MEENDFYDHYDRRQALRKLFFLIAFPILYLVNKMIGKDIDNRSKKIITIPISEINDPYISKDFIIVKNGQQFKVYDPSCTHLGCKIQESEDGTLVCPCHGSRFGSDGRPVKGPAVKPLKALQYRIGSGKMIIEV